VLPIFQHAYDSFNPKLKLEVSLEEPIHYYIKYEREAVRERMFQLMADMNLSRSLLAKYPDEVSGGQLQRFNVIRTLMLQPDMIVCDEITSSLDVVAEGRMLSILKHYYETHNQAMVIISHDMAVLNQLAQHFIVMKDGEIVDDFPKHNIFSSSRHPYTKKLLSLYLE
jgi:peptide/nickel transport system ATP-binding protein